MFRSRGPYAKAQHLALAWQSYVDEAMRRHDTAAGRRQRQLVLSLSPSDPTPRSEITLLTPHLAAGEPVEPFFPDELTEEARLLRDRLERPLRQLNMDLENVRRDLISLGLGDRQADGWAALVSIGDHAGAEWSRRAREAARVLGARRPAESSSLAIRLLGDLRQVFGGADRLWTRDILHRLHAIDDAPWSDLGGRPLTARRLAGLLRPFGVNRTEVRIGDSTTKGYRREDLADALERWLPSPAEAFKGRPNGNYGNEPGLVGPSPDEARQQARAAEALNRSVTRDVAELPIGTRESGDDAVEMILAAFPGSRQLPES